jgi:hypothetical protein
VRSDTRPIFHKRDDTICGYLFYSFLAVLLRVELDEGLAPAMKPDWADIVQYRDRLQ